MITLFFGNEDKFFHAALHTQTAASDRATLSEIPHYARRVREEKERKMEKTKTRRQDLLRQRDALVAEIRFRPANGLPAREGTGLGGRFLSATEVAERSAAIGRLNAAIKAAEAEEKAARERRQAEQARRDADLALKARKGERRAAAVVAAYRAATPATGVRNDRRARKAAVNGWDLLVGNYDK